jgi:hypothetical protein
MMSQTPEMDLFLQNFPLPKKPSGLLPELPRNIGDIGDFDLMELYTDFMAWLVFAKAQLVQAEITEERERNILEYLQSSVLIEQWGDKAKGDLVTVAKAKRDVDPKIVDQIEIHMQKRAYRKLVDTVFDRCERGAQVVSRELSRRIGMSGKEVRQHRFTP